MTGHFASEAKRAGRSEAGTLNTIIKGWLATSPEKRCEAIRGEAAREIGPFPFGRTAGISALSLSLSSLGSINTSLSGAHSLHTYCCQQAISKLRQDAQSLRLAFWSLQSFFFLFYPQSIRADEKRNRDSFESNWKICFHRQLNS